MREDSQGSCDCLDVSDWMSHIKGHGQLNSLSSSTRVMCLSLTDYSVPSLALNLLAAGVSTVSEIQISNLDSELSFAVNHYVRFVAVLNLACGQRKVTMELVKVVLLYVSI